MSNDGWKKLIINRPPADWDIGFESRYLALSDMMCTIIMPQTIILKISTCDTTAKVRYA
jgi:hypothetical protein